jgi:hypothetical protein
MSSGLYAAYSSPSPTPYPSGSPDPSGSPGPSASPSAYPSGSPSPSPLSNPCGSDPGKQLVNGVCVCKGGYSTVKHLDGTFSCVLKTGVPGS